jgi:hypothetical protein
MIESYFTSGAATAVILTLMMLEAFVLARWMKRVPAMFWGLLAGAAMVLALGAALMQYRFEVIGILLAISFLFHFVEVRQWLRTAKRLPA